MDYSIKNANQHIGNDLLSKAKELANNSVRTKGGSFTEAELDQLLQEANKDGKITPEEVRFVAGLTNEHNVQNLSKSNFKPVNGQLQFQNVSTPRLNKINDQATKINDATKTKNQPKYINSLANLVFLREKLEIWLKRGSLQVRRRNCSRN